MDLPTSYGTRLLSPFDWHWFAVDWMPIVDIYLLMVLVAGLLVRRGVAGGDGAASAAIVLTFMAANYGVRGGAHHRRSSAGAAAVRPDAAAAAAIPASAERLIDRGRARVPSPPPRTGTRCLVEIAAMPTFMSPFSWRIIAHCRTPTRSATSICSTARFRTADATPRAVAMTLRYPEFWTPAVWHRGRDAARPGRFSGSRASRPRDRPSIGTATTTVRWTDMRFAARSRRGDQVGRARLFTAVVRIGPRRPGPRGTPRGR